ncbi:MAG: hypothetical protein QOG88_1726 [Actinomycetota bacterium]|nr:hypothetical protein [Actinomycetota bacterium]
MDEGADSSSRWEPIDIDDIDTDTAVIAGRHHVRVTVTLNAPAPAEWTTFFLEADGFHTVGRIEWRFDAERRTVSASPRIDPAGLWEEDFTSRAYSANRRYEYEVLDQR